jgi:hypothetical protein
VGQKLSPRPNRVGKVGGRELAVVRSWPAEIRQFGHETEGKGNVMILGFIGVCDDPVPII